jgi:hypothetical protein
MKNVKKKKTIENVSGIPTYHPEGQVRLYKHLRWNVVC